jgi:hypothetical protein
MFKMFSVIKLPFISGVTIGALAMVCDRSLDDGETWGIESGLDG